MRGISDFSDERKSLLESTSKGKWRKLAAENASRFVQLLISDSALLDRTSRGIRGYQRHRDNKQVVRIALIWNDTVHYVSESYEGFRDELRARLAGRFEFIFSQGVGSPEKDAHESNKLCVKNVVGQFGQYNPDYVVTIGTAVTVAAIETLSPQHKILFLGVSDPESLNLSNLAKHQRPLVAGVRYGLPIELSVEILKLAFPDRIPVFVHSGDRYLQDTTLVQVIRNRCASDVKLQSLESPAKLEPDASRHVFFGRFFFCRNMGEFSKHNPDAMLIGVSKQNIGYGAVMSIGFEPEQIGRVGAQQIEKDLASNPKLSDGQVEQPLSPMIAVNNRKLQRLKVVLPPALPQRYNIQYYDDI